MSPAQTTVAEVPVLDATSPWWWQRHRNAEHGVGSAVVLAQPVGVVGGSQVGWVDRRGRLYPSNAGWSLDWAVQVGDEWRFAGATSAVRHDLVDGNALVESRLRIEGGEVTHQVYAVPGSDGQVQVVVRLRNGGKVPVAVAAVLGPWNLHGAAPQSMTFGARAAALTVDGADVVGFSRPPAHVLTAGIGDDLSARLRAFAADAGSGRVATDDEAVAPLGGSLAAVWPLIHEGELALVTVAAVPQPQRRRSLRRRQPQPAPAVLRTDAVPGVDQIAAGWDRHIESGTTIDCPDARLARFIGYALPTALVLVGDDALAVVDRLRLAAALALWGHPSDAAALARLHADAEGTPEEAAAWLGAAAISDLMKPSEDIPDDLVPGTEWALRRLVKASPSVWTDVATTWGRHWLTARGQPAAATVTVERPDIPPAPGATNRAGYAALLAGAGRTAAAAELLTELAASVEADGGLDDGGIPPGLGCDVAALAESLLALVGLFVSVRADGAPAEGSATTTVQLVPEQIPSFVGHNWGANRLVTPAGSLSFAIRWHGPRPALLWELTLWSPTAPAAIDLRCGMDPSFAGLAAAGETLLAAPEGLVAAPPAEGDSFS